jgi:hypothetical protein
VLLSREPEPTDHDRLMNATYGFMSASSPTLMAPSSTARGVIAFQGCPFESAVPGRSEAWATALPLAKSTLPPAGLWQC